MKDNRYYKGFEGEPEIVFSSSQDSLSMWSGYFDAIMKLVYPKENGWSELAHCYHLNEGWYEDSPYKVRDLEEAVSMFQLIEISQLDQNCSELLNLLLALISAAIENNDDIYISYE